MMFNTGQILDKGMPESNNYTTISVKKPLRDELSRIKDESQDTYTDVISRALANQLITRDEIDRRLNFQEKILIQQSVLMARMAQEMGVPDEDIPGDFLERADRRDPSDPFSLPQDIADAIEEDSQ